MRTVKCKDIKTRGSRVQFKQAKALPPLQYDEFGIVMNPTEDQMFAIVEKAERDYWARVKAGRKIRAVTCVEDILNGED